MDVGADFPADTQSAEPAQKCEGRFDDPAVLAQAASVLGAAPGDERTDAQLTDLAAVDVVVVTAVGVEDVGGADGVVRACRGWAVRRGSGAGAG